MSHPGACVALVYVFALLTGQPLDSGWLASHPSPDRSSPLLQDVDREFKPWREIVLS
jgi:hypothetical protein